MNENLDVLPIVTISRRGADRLRAGHVWVYRSEMLDGQSIAPGSLVTIAEEGGRGRPPHARRLGTAFYSSASEIALRMISTKPVHYLEQLIRERIRVAIAYRERFVRNSNAYRLIFSEGDFLPGLIVDRYNDMKVAKKWRLPWWGMLCVFVATLLVGLALDRFGRFDLARPTLFSMVPLTLAIAIKRDLTHQFWFWITIAIAAAIHFVVILSVHWNTRRIPAITLAPIVTADFYALLRIA